MSDDEQRACGCGACEIDCFCPCHGLHLDAYGARQGREKGDVMSKEAFRGVIWPRPPREPGGLHRYAIVGVLLTDQPLPIDANQEFIDGQSVQGMLADALLRFPHRPTSAPLGDATNVLRSLDELPTIIEDQEARGR